MTTYERSQRWKERENTPNLNCGISPAVEADAERERRGELKHG